MSNLTGISMRKSQKRLLEFPALSNGYSYENFVSDCFDYMMDGFEFTKTYFICPESLFLAKSNKNMVTFGVTYGLLWVVKLNGTDYCYIEVVNKKVQDDLVGVYVDQFLDSENMTGVARETERERIIAVLENQYVENTLRVIRELNYTVSKSDDDLTPVGICNLEDTQMETINGQLVPAYNISLSQFVLICMNAKLRVSGLYEKNPTRFFSSNVGWWDAGIDSLQVTANGSVIFVRGLVGVLA